MTLHILKNPLSPLALQVIKSESLHGSTVASLLPATENLPLLPGITIYQVTDSCSADNNQRISYSRLVDMIFEADKVVAW
jgi:hypothetical protein